MVHHMNHNPFGVADSLTIVTELAEQAYRAEIPGFQVSEILARKVGLVPVMESIEAGSEIALGVGVLFTTSPFLYNEPGEYPPHTDGGFRGLSLHHNESGSGMVQIAHLLDGSQPEVDGARIFIGPGDGNYRSYKGGGIETIDVEHGPIFEGTLEPGRFTVFSQGNIDGLPPAIHYFKRNAGGNWWTRYSSSCSDAERTPYELMELSHHFKLGLTQGEYRRIIDDERMQKYYAEKGEVIPEDERMRSRFDLEELEMQLKIHPGKNIVSMGLDHEAGIIRYKMLNRFERAKRLVGSNLRRK